MQNINLYDVMKKETTKNPNKTLLADTSNEVSNKDFLIKVNVMAQKIYQHTQGEQRVGVFLPNVVSNVVVLFALFKNEQTPAILNFTMGSKTIVETIEVAELQSVITSRKFIKESRLEATLDEIEKVVRVYYLEDMASQISLKQRLFALIDSKKPQLKTKRKVMGEVVLYTSGTESVPKGVVLTHANILANINQMEKHASVTKEDKILNPLPLFHSFGLTIGAIMPFALGIRSFLFPSPLLAKKIVERIKEEQSTLFVATNSFYELYSKFATKENMGSLRIAVAGAEKLKQPLKDFYKENIGIELYEGYGATEASPVIAIGVPGSNKNGSVGKMLDGIEYKLRKIEGVENGGSLLLKGPNLMKGYLIKGRGFAPLEDWYDTGDVVEIDEEGFVFIKARLKRFSKIAGEMISLTLLEDLASTAVNDPNICAVAIPDKKRGEKIVLFTASEEYDKKEFRKRVSEEIAKRNLSNLYVPSSIEKIENIPLLGSGKANYRHLEMLAEQL